MGKLRVYDIGGQDETGAWALHAFPEIKWLRSVNMFYGFAPWPKQKVMKVWDKNFLHLRLAHGGEVKDQEEFTGPDVEETIGDAWVDRHVQSGHGPLGALYPERSWAYEGDTPAFLYLLPNGLSDPEKQWYGGWGGRFSKQLKKNPQCFQQRLNKRQKPYEPFFAYTGASDEWTSADGRVWKSQFASQFRWRKAFQNDFQARMDWCVKPREEANHPPRPVVNGDDSPAVLYIKSRPGAVIELDASESSDPDGDRLNFHWMIYNEISDLKGVEISGADTAKSIVKIPTAPAGRVHVILVCTDAGDPPLTRYRRFIASVGAESSENNLLNYKQLSEWVGK